MRLVKRAQANELDEAASDTKPNYKPKQVATAAMLVFEALPGIVEKLIEKAMEGSCQHAKCVFDLARVAEVQMAKDEPTEPWVLELLSALRAIPDPTQPTPAV
jgi:hypothetical protein